MATKKRKSSLKKEVHHIHHHKKHQHISIYVIAIIILAFQILTILLSSNQLADLDDKNKLQRDNLKAYLESRVKENDMENQAKIKEITETLLETESALELQIGDIKSEASSDFTEVIERTVKGVVTIKTNAAQGTGFLVSSNGYVVTNAHVLSNAMYAEVTNYDQESNIQKAQLYSS